MLQILLRADLYLAPTWKVIGLTPPVFKDSLHGCRMGEIKRENSENWRKDEECVEKQEDLLHWFFGTDVSTSNEAVTVICPDIQNGVGGTWFFLVAVHFIFVGVGVATQ